MLRIKYQFKPQLLLCVIYLTEQEIRERGLYDKLYWRMDSTSIAVTVSFCEFSRYYFLKRNRVESFSRKFKTFKYVQEQPKRDLPHDIPFFK